MGTVIDMNNTPEFKLVIPNLEGRLIHYNGKNDFEGAESTIVDFYGRSINSNQTVLHEIPSAGLVLPKINLTKVILTLEQGNNNWYEVNMLTEPFITETEIFDSHYKCKRNASIAEQEKQARRVYETIANMLRRGNFKIHVFYDQSVNLEQIRK